MNYQTSIEDHTEGVRDDRTGNIFDKDRRGHDIRLVFQNPNELMKCSLDNGNKRDRLHDCAHLANFADHNVGVVGLVKKRTGDTLV